MFNGVQCEFHNNYAYYTSVPQAHHDTIMNTIFTNKRVVICYLYCIDYY